MDTYDLFFRFGAALLIGMLVGVQREYAYEDVDREMFAGTRTFTLMALLGCTTAFAADHLGSPNVFIGILIVLGVFIATAYFIDAWQHKQVGITTEVSALISTLVGALCYWNYIVLAVAIGVTMTLILTLKLELQTFVRRITREDILATLRFAIITAIVLPILPNQTYGPLDVLNPYQIWQMIVLISGISFLGYVLFKVIGARQGIGLTGLMGGLVSSTAVTLSFAQRSQDSEGLEKPFALAITLAWMVMFPRVLIEVAVVNQELLAVLWPPLAAAGVVGLGYCIYLYFSHRPEEEGLVQVTNPFELGPAITFGLIFAVVIFVSKAAQIYLGDTGVYLSSLLSGLADVDAITLSIAELSHGSGGLDLKVAERAIVLAAMANTAVKGGIVLTMGSTRLRKVLWPAFLLILLTGLIIAFLF